MQDMTLADPGGAAGARAPQQDQFLSFSHTFLPKSMHRRLVPPNGLVPPQWEILDPPLHDQVYNQNNISEMKEQHTLPYRTK